MVRLFFIAFILSLHFAGWTQNVEAIFNNCGTSQIYQSNKIFLLDPQTLEAQYVKDMQHGSVASITTTKSTVTLPIVVHIIHNNGSENISDNEVIQGIQFLNDAFSASFGTGVNTDIQFCLAQRTPTNQATNGITRDVSSLTTMDMNTQDLDVKNINRWDPNCYINIWLVKEIVGGVAGYAYLPGSHGTIYDGIVMETNYFGSSRTNSAVLTHEIGHYLGLFHTFENACSNFDCLNEGDHVCDTPPDNTTFSLCNPNANSCSTDADDKSSNNPLTTDVSDHGQNYLDYSSLNCYSELTQGQSDRMHWFIDHVRNSLLNCKSCITPCNAVVRATISSPSSMLVIPTGTAVNFASIINNSTNLEWSFANGNVFSTLANPTYTFNQVGDYKITLLAKSANPYYCSSDSDHVQVKVLCSAIPDYYPKTSTVLIHNSIHLINKSTGTTSYDWLLNGSLVNSNSDFIKQFDQFGNFKIQLVVKNQYCVDTLDIPIHVITNCSSESFQLSFESPFEDELNSNIQSPDQNYVFVGSTQKNLGVPEGHIYKISQQGKLMWSKSIANTNLLQIINCTSGGYIIVGAENYSWINCIGNISQTGIILKIDDQGQLLWSKKIKMNTQNGETINSILELSNGNFAFSGIKDRACSVSSIIHGVIDPNGNLIWMKSYDSFSSDIPSKIIELNNGDLIFSGSSRQNIWTDGLAMKVQATTGNIQWIKCYDVDDPNNINGNNDFMSGLILLPNGNPLLVGNTASLLDWNTTVSENSVATLELDPSNGNVLHHHNYVFDKSLKMSASAVDFNPKDNEIVFAGIDASPIPNISKGSGVSGIFKTDLNGKPLFASYLTSGYLNDVTLVNGMEYLLCGYDGVWQQAFKTNHIVKVNNLLETPGCPLEHPLVIDYQNFNIGEITGNWNIIDEQNAYQNFNARIDKFDSYLLFPYCYEECPNPICPNINVNPFSHQSICKKDSLILTGPGNMDSYRWHPGTNLNDSTIQNPICTANTSTTYTLTCQKASSNIISNYDFKKGNFAFSSDYIYSNANLKSGEYSVTNFLPGLDPKFPNCQNHSTSDVQMMVIKNNAPALPKIYAQRLELAAHTKYKLEVWLLNLNLLSAPEIVFAINGKELNQKAIVKTSNCTWSLLEDEFISDSSGVYEISIILKTINQAVDLGLDDITCKPICAYEVIREVEVINYPAKPLDLGPDFEICENGTWILDAGFGYAKYEWNNGSNLQTQTVYLPGKYKVIVTDSCGVKDQDSIIIRTKLPPKIDLEDSVIVCKNQWANLEIKNKQDFDNYTWTSKDSILCAKCPLAKINITDNTKVYVVASTKDGCSSIDSIQFAIKNSVTQNLNFDICNRDSILVGNKYYYQSGQYQVILLNTQGCDSIINFTIKLLPPSYATQTINLCPGQFFTVNQNVYSQAGSYFDTLSTLKGCDSILKTIIDILPNPQKNKSIFLCKNEAYSYKGKVYTQKITIRDTITSFFGCDTIFQLDIDNEAPWNISSVVDSVRCHGEQNGKIVLTNQNTALDIDFTWDNGLKQKNQTDLDSLQPGIYKVQLKSNNNCIDSLRFIIYEPSPLSLRILHDIQLCSEDSLVDLQFMVVDSSNGKPYKIYKNGILLPNDKFSKDIADGIYYLEIEDKKGCRYGIYDTVPKISILHLEADKIIKLKFGDQIQLSINASGKLPLSYQWSPADNLSCTDCYNPILTAKVSTQYVVTVTDSEGCSKTVQVQIQVDQDNSVFFPNVFSPNGDGINDTVFPNGKHIQQLDYLEIYDRWGELIYKGTNILKNAKDNWDGSFRGDKLNPAVFVYIAKVRFEDGSTTVATGDVTLIR